MKQKLGLASALLAGPACCCWMSRGGRGPHLARELWKMVHELIAQGLTVVLEHGVS